METYSYSPPSDAEIRRILNDTKSFALVGASDNPVRPSYFVLKYLLAKGYRVVPVNPGLSGREILGQKVAASLADIEGTIDVVDIFRNSNAALGITKEAIALKDKLQLRVIWMQLGVQNEEAASLALAAGLKVVMNRCPKIEYGRLSGEIAWAGVNNRVLSSQKPVMLGRGFQQLRVPKSD